jgi:phasin family protein
MTFQPLRQGKQAVLEKRSGDRPSHRSPDDELCSAQKPLDGRPDPIIYRTAQKPVGARLTRLSLNTLFAGEITMENGSEAVKATVDRMTMAGNQAFRDTIEKSLGALNEANAHSKRNLEAVVESVTAATRGAETLGAQALAFSKKSWEDSVAAAQSLGSAKSVQEVVEIQTNFAKSALETYLTELNRWSDTVSASVKDTLKPLNERVTATVERMQASR